MGGLKMENNNIFNLLKLYDNEISKNVKNKNKLIKFERHKLENIINICNCINENYFIKHYNIFLIYEPKVRVIMSLNIHDKLINHFMTRYVLEPKLTKYLDNRNIATRVGLGCDYGIKLVKKYLNKMKKYNNFYILKLDIKKYFYNINHDKLKEMIKNDLNNTEFKIISNIIDSTNEDYINKIINKLGKGRDLPLYQKGRGLPIGNLTSQFLSIYYLYQLDHFIIHKLHLKYYVRYMDDFIIIHENKKYLEKCLKIIINKLNKEYKLEINENKTNIINIKDGFIFLGYKFFLKNNKTICILRNETYNKFKKNIKKRKYFFDNNIINFEQYFSSINNYLYSYKYGSIKKINNYIKSVI